jgi:L-aspartate oxidase
MSSTAQSQVKQVKTEKTDFLVIGSGLAGLAFALEACALGKVTIVTKSKASLANTALAQGGIASVMSEDDTFTSHADDTLRKMERHSI